jgi:hypothetical protein
MQKADSRIWDVSRECMGSILPLVSLQVLNFLMLLSPGLRFGDWRGMRNPLKFKSQV